MNRLLSQRRTDLLYAPREQAHAVGLLRRCVVLLATMSLAISVPFAVMHSIPIHFVTIFVVAASGLICLVDLTRTMKNVEPETFARFGPYQILSLATGVLLLVSQWGALLEASTLASEISFTRAIAAMLLLVAGATIRFFAIRELGRAFVSHSGSRRHSGIVTTGMFSVVRHPSETGLSLCLLGMLIGASAWYTAIIVLPVFLVLSCLRIVAEERWLMATHGDSFGDYSRTVPRNLAFGLIRKSTELYQSVLD